MVRVFCSLVCAPTDIALGLLVWERGVLCTHVDRSVSCNVAAKWQSVRHALHVDSIHSLH